MWVRTWGTFHRQSSPLSLLSFHVCLPSELALLWFISLGVESDPMGPDPEIRPGHVGMLNLVSGESPWSQANEWELSVPNHSAGTEEGEWKKTLFHHPSLPRAAS